MSYYSEMNKAKTRIRNHWLIMAKSGEDVTLDKIFYDLDKQHFEYSEKALKKYISRMCRVEDLDFNGKEIKPYDV